MHTLHFAPPSEGSSRDDSGRPVGWYVIHTDLAPLFLRTVKVRASYIAHALRDTGIEKVSDPVLAECDPSKLWIIDVVAPDVDGSTIFTLHTESRMNAATFATMLSNVFRRHQVCVSKYDHLRYVFALGALKYDLLEFDLDVCRTAYGHYRLPADWL